MKRYYKEFITKNLCVGDRLMINLKDGHFYIYPAKAGAKIQFREEHIIFNYENEQKIFIDYANIENMEVLK